MILSHHLNEAGESRAKASRDRLVEGLYRTHAGRLVGYLRRQFGDGPPDPEDIAQEAFSRLARFDELPVLENPKAYLYKIAVNSMLTAKGRARRSDRFLAESLDMPDASLQTISPETIYADRQALSRLGRHIESLTPKQREILIRVRLRGETFTQISEQCGWSLADISRQLKAALTRLMQECPPE